MVLRASFYSYAYADFDTQDSAKEAFEKFQGSQLKSSFLNLDYALSKKRSGGDGGKNIFFFSFSFLQGVHLISWDCRLKLRKFKLRGLQILF